MRVEVEPEEIDHSLDHAYHHVVKEVAIPGFRKGKAPRAVLEQYVGREALRKEALEELVPELCLKIVEEQKLEVVAQPQVEVVQQDPVVFKATFSLRPEIELGDYRSIRMERPAVEVGEAEVDDFVQNLRERHADWVPASRPVAYNDMAIIDVSQTPRGGETRKHEGQQVLVLQDSMLPLPGFSEHLVGLGAGEEKEFTLSYPEDYRLKDLAGKEIGFKVKLVEVKEKHLPDLDDEFVSSLGEDLDSVEGLRRHAAEGLQKVAQDRAAREHEGQVLAAVVEGAVRLEYPPVFVEEEIDRLIHDSSFHERKAWQIQRIAQQVLDEHGGELPCDRELLMSFSGVGVKCANVHVHRVTNRWGYVAAGSPERTTVLLEAKLPRRYWLEINRLLVPFGKHVCTGRLPRCSTCPVLEMCRQVGVEKHR